MGRFVLRRVLIAIPVLIGVTLLSFFLVNLAPGDPVTAFIDPVTRAELGPEWVEQRQKELGLDKPLVVRYGLWLCEVVQGTWGTRSSVTSRWRSRSAPGWARPPC